MRNVYTVRLEKPVTIDTAAPHFGSSTTSHLYVTASSFENALEAVRRKFPNVVVRGIDFMNYTGSPIIAGD